MDSPETTAPERDVMAYYLARVDKRPRWFHFDRRIGGLLADRRGSVSLVTAISLAVAVMIGWKTIRPQARPAIPAAALPLVTEDRSPIAIAPSPETAAAPAAIASRPSPVATAALPMPAAATPDRSERPPARTHDKAAPTPKPQPVTTSRTDPGALAVLHAQGPVVPLHGEALRQALIADRAITRNANIARLGNISAPEQPAGR